MLCLYLSAQNRCPSVAEQVNANTAQCRNGPLWIFFLLLIVQLREEVFHKLRISIVQDSFACQPHQIQLIVYVVHCQQMRASSLLGGDMIDVGAGDSQTSLCGRSAASALAAVFDWAKVLGIHGVAEVEHASGCNGIAEALGLSESSQITAEGRLTAVLVGHTQSNMSAPSATETTRSSG